jgi:hypothetical protein
MITKEQKIINMVQDKLPIKVFPERFLLPKLRESFSPDIKLDTILEVHRMLDMGIEGGILCEILPLNVDRATVTKAVLASLTHLRVKVGEPHFEILEKYRTDRIRKLKQQNERFGFR